MKLCKCYATKGNYTPEPGGSCPVLAKFGDFLVIIGFY